MTRRPPLNALLFRYLGLNGFTLLLALWLVAAPFLLSACQQAPPAEGEKKDGAKEAAADGEEGSDEEGEEGEEEGDGEEAPPKPKAPLPLPSKQLSFRASDGMVLNGWLSDPTQKPVDPDAEEEEGDEESASDGEDSAEAGDGGEEGEDGEKGEGEGEGECEESASEPPLPAVRYPLVILLHSLNSTHKDWGKFPDALVQHGYAVLSMDLRGHGQSARFGKTKGRIQNWRAFEPADWQKYPGDLLTVIKTFSEDKAYRYVDFNKISIVGASIGANTAILASQKLGNSIRSLVLLSPGEDYKGLQTALAVVQSNTPMLMVASQEDPYAFKSTQNLYKWASPEKSIKLYKDIGHGLDMLRYYPDLANELIVWLDGHLVAKPAVVPDAAQNKVVDTHAAHHPAPNKPSHATPSAKPTPAAAHKK